MKLSTWEKGRNPDACIRNVEIEGRQFKLHAYPMLPGDHFGDCMWSVWQDGRMKKSGMCEGLHLAKERAEVTALIVAEQEVA